MKTKTILKKHKLQFYFTLSLILLETGITLLFPLYIGYAIDSSINGNHQGVMHLGLLGIGVLVVGVGRRVFDTRFYAKIYQTLGSRTILKMDDQKASKKSAHLGMIRELIEFLENSLPELIHNIFGLIGVVIILATLNLKIFFASLVVTITIYLIYWLTSTKTIRLNTSSNDEFEKQVDIISKNNKSELKSHLSEMMKWNIKLSDLEAINFSISWIVLLVFLIASIVISTSGGIVKYGVLFSLVMYVFQYIENVINLPYFYQTYLRLHEIRKRLENSSKNSRTCN